MVTQTSAGRFKRVDRLAHSLASKASCDSTSVSRYSSSTSGVRQQPIAIRTSFVAPFFQRAVSPPRLSDWEAKTLHCFCVYLLKVNMASRIRLTSRL